MNIVSFPTFSLLKPNTLKAVPKQIKAKQRRALTGQDFQTLPSVRRKRALPEEIIQLLTYMREREWGEGGRRASWVLLFPLTQGPRLLIR